MSAGVARPTHHEGGPMMPETGCRDARLVLVFTEGEPGLRPGAGPMQIIAAVVVHVPRFPPALRARATASSAAVVSSHSSSAARPKPRRWNTLRKRDRRGARRSRRKARCEPACVFSLSGIFSSDASRLNTDSSAASSGSDPASPSWIDSRACRSHALRLMASLSAASARLDAWWLGRVW
jgi:hypothetical protein